MRRLLPLTALATLALAPAAAQAHVVPGEGMLGLRVGDSLRHVRAVLGAPDRTLVRHDEILGRVRNDRYGKTGIAYDATGPAAHVITLTTKSKRERLAGGIGVGTTRAALQAAIPGLDCTGRHCTLGRFRAGRIVTEFTVRHGRVVRVTVGRVID